MTHRHRAHSRLSTTFPWLMVAMVVPAIMAFPRDRQPWGEAAALAAPESVALSATLAQAETPGTDTTDTNDSPPEVSPLAGPNRDVPWWPWIVAFPGLGGVLWWVLRETSPVTDDQKLESRLPSVENPLMAGASDPVEAGEPPTVSDADTNPEGGLPRARRIILVPRSSHAAYAYWELPAPEVEALKERHCTLALKVHDVTDIAQVDQQPPHATELWDCPTQATGDRHLTLAQENRDYLLELGYRDESDTWHALVRSEPVHSPVPSSLVPPDPVPEAQVAAAELSATAEPFTAASPPDTAPLFVAKPAAAKATLTPQTCHSAEAHWELSPDHIADLQTGNYRLTVRLFDVTELPGGFSAGPNSMQDFDVDLVPQSSRVIPIAIDDRDYLIEVGYVTENGHWQVLAKSSPVRVPACNGNA